VHEELAARHPQAQEEKPEHLRQPVALHQVYEAEEPAAFTRMHELPPAAIGHRKQCLEGGVAVARIARLHPADERLHRIEARVREHNRWINGDGRKNERSGGDQQRTIAEPTEERQQRSEQRVEKADVARPEVAQAQPSDDEQDDHTPVEAP
jgi:hypothetical protein